MICANVLPRQHTKIPWGWKNATIESTICGQETYVVEPKGDLGMPDLCAYFDWTTFIIEGSPIIAPLGTRNYKSVFTTATRLLGTERLLEEQPDLSGITEQFVEWNSRLIELWGLTLQVFFLGDDFAGNNGLFMSPEVWRQWLRPQYAKLLYPSRNMYRIFHSDGDIFPILDDLAELEVDAVSYEPVGKMAQIGPKYKGMRMIPVEDQRQTHANSMALQR